MRLLKPLSQFSGQLNDDACPVQIQDHDDSFENIAEELFDRGALPLFEKEGSGEIYIATPSRGKSLR